MEGKKHILIVDDSYTIRKFLAISLLNEGFTISGASDGIEALEKLALKDINLILTDINMPNMDGIELIRSIASDEEFKHIPIIVLSSLSKEEDVTRAIDAGAKTYLNKPFNQKKVIEEINKYLID